MAEINLILEEDCSECGGLGYTKNYNQPIKTKINGEEKTIGFAETPCKECGSLGRITTLLGDEILDFVRKHLGRRLSHGN
jgi:hypothetical protein